jgi:uncharacterized membrane protein YkvA (DUF1232 family)
LKKALPYILVAFALLYDISPADLIPDAPVIGWIDDIVVTLAAVANLLHKRKKEKTEQQES